MDILKPSSHVAWKGKTFYQITSSIRLNGRDPTITNRQQFFKPAPIKGYRREIASASAAAAAGACNKRTLLKMDELNAPGGYILTTNLDSAKAMGGYIGTLESNLPNNTSETPDPCFLDNCKTTSTDSSNVCFRPDMNALRRCRSAGMNNRKFIPPPRSEIGTSMEALIHHFKLWTDGFNPPKGSVYATIESPRGEQGVFLESNGSTKPYRIHYRTPSISLLQALPQMAKGHFVADLVGVIGSIDVVMGDNDR